MKKIVSMLMVMMASIVALAMGASGDALMSSGLTAADSQGDGNVAAGSAQSANGAADGGIMNVSQGQQIAGEGGDGLYTRDVDEVVLKINPMSTPLLQITSYASSSEVDSQEFEYWSVGPRIGRSTVASAPVNGADRFKLPIADKGFVTKDDTIRVVGVKGYEAGTDNVAKEDLVLFVINVDEETGFPICCCVNGKKSDKFKAPATLVQGKVLIRMGKSCGEMDAQTGRFHNYPEPEIQYTQNFMFQVEQSTFDKMTSKKVKWDFNDIEEAGIRDMKIAQENTYMFGVKRKMRHPNKENINQYFTGGLWWQAGKDIEIGHLDNGQAVISDDDLVTFAREVFVGSAGNKRKVMLCGSKMLEKFGQIRSDRFRLKETVDVWNLTFSRFHTDFGDVLVIYDEQFDMNGMSAYGFCIDPEFIKKKVFMSLKRTVLELIKSGQRNSNAVVLQEVAGVYLQYADAHARVQLVGNAGAYDWNTAAKFDYHKTNAAIPPKKKSYDGNNEGASVGPDEDVTGA